MHVPCPGYEGLYVIDAAGVVIRVAPARGATVGLVLKSVVDGRGYETIRLRREETQRSLKIHRLVCEAFHGPPPKGKRYVNHKDGNKLNNTPSNLEWVSSSENALHAHRTGLVRPCRGVNHPRAQAVERVSPEGVITQFDTITSACAATPGARRDRVWEVATGGRKLKTHAGFIWRFV